MKNKKIKEERIWVKAIILALIFAIGSLLLLFVHSEKKYYVIYKNMDDDSYKTEYVTTTERRLIKKYSEYDIVIIDQIISEEDFSDSEVRKLITNNNDFDIKFNDDVILSESELNTYGILAIVSKDGKTINFDNLNNYLKKMKKEYTFDNTDSAKILLSKSYILKDKKLVKLTNGPLYKIIDTQDKISELDDIIVKASNRLQEMSKENGAFVYGYYILDGSVVSGYNALRHAGTIWSLILSYEISPNDNLKNVIDNAIKCMLDNYLYDGPTSEIKFIKSSGYINIGGNGLALLALSEYQKVFNDDKYYDVAKTLANGIVYAQQDDGHINHQYNLDYSINKDYVISYYDGEATFALMKFYEVSKDEKYLDSVTKAMDYFIEKKYEKYSDHWISYALNEFLRYNHDEKYISFMTKHYNEKNDTSTNFIPARVEGLMAIYDAYEYLISLKLDSPSLKTLSKDKLLNSVDKNITNLLRFYIDDEILIYLEQPNLVSYGFYTPNDSNRMRIDDIQHTLGALIHYKNLKDSKRLK